MLVMVRPDTVKDQSKLTWLYNIANNMLTRLDYLGYQPEDGVCRIWIKGYMGKEYPKIEFSFEDKHEELQYEVDGNGQICEVAFKKFIKCNGTFIRQDMSKKDMCLEIKYIDTVIRESFD